MAAAAVNTTLLCFVLCSALIKPSRLKILSKKSHWVGTLNIRPYDAKAQKAKSAKAQQRTSPPNSAETCLALQSTTRRSKKIAKTANHLRNQTMKGFFSNKKQDKDYMPPK